MRRRGFRVLLGLLALIAIAALAAVAAAPVVLETVATRALRSAGYADGSVIIQRLGLDGVEGAVRLDATGEQGIDRFRIAYSWDGISRRRLDRVAIDGARLSVSGSEEGGPFEMPDLPVDEIRVTDTTFTVDTPEGPLAVAVDLDAAAVPDQEAFMVQGRVGVGRLVTGTVSAEQISVAGEGWLDFGGGGLIFTPLDCLTVHADRIAAADLELSRPDPLCVRAAEGQPLLEIAADAEGNTTIAADFRLDPATLAVAAAPDRDAVLREVSGRFALDGRMQWDAEGLTVQGQLRMENGTVDTGTAVARGVTGVVTADGPVAAFTIAVALDARQITAETVSAERISVEGEGRVDVDEGGLRFTPAGCLSVRADKVAASGLELARPDRLCIRAVRDRPLLEIVADADGNMATTADFRIDRIALAMAGQGRDAVLREASGTIALDGRIAWAADGLSGRTRLLLEDGKVDTGSFIASGINGVLTADRLMPLSMPAGQTLSVALVDFGVPLTDGIVQFRLRPGGVLDVARAEWRWAGGILRTAPFRTPLPAPEGTFILEAENIDLGEVLELVMVEGLKASGTLHGRLPVHIGRQSVSVHEGRLETSGPGALRYAPEKPPAFLSGAPGSPTQMLLDVLTDFQYESIAMTINGVAGGEMTVGLTIRGSNPEFHRGHPVVLNVNLSGALDTILRRGITAYRIPEAVRERMMEFQSQGQ